MSFLSWLGSAFSTGRPTEVVVASLVRQFNELVTEQLGRNATSTEIAEYQYCLRNFFEPRHLRRIDDDPLEFLMSIAYLGRVIAESNVKFGRRDVPNLLATIMQLLERMGRG